MLDLLVRLYSRSLARFFERRVRNAHDVPDLVQDVFLRMSALPDPLSVEKPENYLFVTAASALRDKARRDTARRADLHDELDHRLHSSCTITPLRTLEGREAIERLHCALMQLPERSRDIFVLRIFEDCRMVDIAAAIGVSRRAAEKHYARALAHVVLALDEWRHD
ncbi:hypothetical protein NRB_07530 [Novosphingobium sp. 11B]